MKFEKVRDNETQNVTAPWMNELRAFVEGDLGREPTETGTAAKAAQTWLDLPMFFVFFRI